jgi:hypothetical protein
VHRAAALAVLGDRLQLDRQLLELGEMIAGRYACCFSCAPPLPTASIGADLALEVVFLVQAH